MSFLLIEPWDFTQPLFGNGCVTVVNAAIRNVGAGISLVGVTSDNRPIGQWSETQIQGRKLRFLPVLHESAFRRYSWIPANILFTGALARCLGPIRTSGTLSVFTQTYSVLWLLAMVGRAWDIFFLYPGLSNPWTVGKHPRAGLLLARVYDRIQAAALRRASVSCAAAAQDVIDTYNSQLRTQGLSMQVQCFPTSVDCDLFRPQDQRVMRNRHGFASGIPIYAFLGRLAGVKGIPFLIEALRHVRAQIPVAEMLLIGDGEDRAAIEGQVRELGLQAAVHFLGKRNPAEVAELLNCADVCVCGSLAEGFSNAMLEELACGRPIVSTEVSGARELIADGKNGFVVPGRDPVQFADKMMAALHLPHASAISREIAVSRFSERAIWSRAAELWSPMRN